MNTPKNKWEGLRAISILRQSNDKDGDSSTEAQDDHMDVVVTSAGMRVVDTIKLEGVSASAPARIREVVERLFARKRDKNDFDVIAWQVEDRATRSGGEHGMWLQHEAKHHGLLVFFPDDLNRTISDGERFYKYEAAKDTGVSTGRRSAQGQAYAQKKGFFRTAGNTPFGCDRIYYSEENKPKFIIRNFPTGLQEQRDHDTGRVISRYGSTGKKSRNRFKKQRNEYSLLCPGDRDQQKVVRVIFYLRYKKGWRGLRIADFLNRNKIPAPRGKQWSQRQAQIIYENEAYTGCTYSNRTYSGRYFRRDRILGFVALNRDECEVVRKKTFAPKLRSMDDWDRIDQPHMYDFLPRDVRDLAIAAQAQRRAELFDPNRRKKKPNAHPASLFFLSNRLRAVQGETLVGTMSGPPEYKVPYYRHRRSKRGHRKGSIFNNLIPAKPLHDAILGLLADVLQDSPDLRERLQKHVLDHRATLTVDHPDVAQLESERDDLQQKITTLVTTLSGAALKGASGELKRLNERINAIDAQRDAAASANKVDQRPVEAVVEEVMGVIFESRAQLQTLAPAPLRDLVNLFISDATVDMETKAIELKVALPTRALQAPAKKQSKKSLFASENEDNALCPDPPQRSLVGDWTQPLYIVVRCDYVWKRGSYTTPPCYRCRRKAA